MSSQKASSKIRSLWLGCAKQTRTRPADVTWGAFRAFLREDHGPAEIEVIARAVKSLGGWKNIVDAHYLPSQDNAIEAQDLRSLAKENRATAATVTQQDVFFDRLRDSISAVMQHDARYRPFGFSTRKAPPQVAAEGRRVLSLFLSDLHLGSALSGREGHSIYGPVEEARRLASIVHRTCHFKRDYRTQTKLHVWLGGDICDGVIHESFASLAVTHQIAASVHILTQAVTVLAGEFPSVVVTCTPGNHGRLPHKHHDRAYAGKWDNYDSIIYVALKAAVSNLKNVEVQIPETAWVDFIPFPGVRMYLTHGDTHLTVGNPGRALNVAAVERQMMSVNNSAIKTRKGAYSLFGVGHVHVGTVVHTQSGVLLTNGCLTPPNQYSVGMGYQSDVCGQWLVESTQRNVVGDMRYLSVDDDTDADKSLDRIIKPWSGTL